MKFYTNLSVLEGNIATSKVCGVELVFDKVCLVKILQISFVGLAEYVWDKDKDCVLTSASLKGGSLTLRAKF